MGERLEDVFGPGHFFHLQHDPVVLFAYYAK